MISQFIIAVHPSFVRHFAYANVQTVERVATESQASEFNVAKSEHPLEVLTAHRVPKYFASSAILRASWMPSELVPDVEPAPRPNAAPAFLAAASSGTFLRHRSLLI